MKNPFGKIFGWATEKPSDMCAQPPQQGMTTPGQAIPASVSLAVQQLSISNQTVAASTGVFGIGAGQEEPKLLPNNPEEVRLVVPVVGYRAWRASPVTRCMFSFNGTKWEPNKALHAECHRGGQMCTGVNCTCGIYAWRNPQSEFAVAEPAVVSGQVNLWGLVVEHSLGYRAEIAYPKSFFNTGFEARRMAEMFGVPLVDVPSVNQLPPCASVI